MADEAPTPAPPQPSNEAPTESALENMRRGLLTMAFAIMPLAAMAVSIGRLGSLILLVEGTTLELHEHLYVWGTWAAGTTVILLAGAGKAPDVFARSLMTMLGVVVLILGRF